MHVALVGMSVTWTPPNKIRLPGPVAYCMVGCYSYPTRCCCQSIPTASDTIVVFSGSALLLACCAALPLLVLYIYMCVYMSVAAACIVRACMFVLSMALLEGWPLQYYQPTIPSGGKTATKGSFAGTCGKLIIIIIVIVEAF